MRKQILTEMLHFLTAKTETMLKKVKLKLIGKEYN